ncbi:MAG: OmpA family protein [Candidatus Latescibacteria bacterium]|nr:OmpA family protein [Candidatus Latescibacterota bacterium]
MAQIRLFITAILLSMLSINCGLSRTVKGGAIGASAGGVIGGVIGKQYGKTATGALIGASIGGAAGALIGNYMDKQAAEIERDLEGAQVERVGEGIKITFDSGILFQTNSYELDSPAISNIEQLANILKKYEDTDILVDGHTDSTGSDEYNQTLSERRAKSVAVHLVSNGIMNQRIMTIGHGETEPVASNDTPDGRRLNRRVEIAIMANEKLQKAAKEGKQL